MYELTRADDPGRIVARGEELRPLLDAAVLGAVRFGKGYRIHSRWVADGRWGAAGTELHRLRCGVEPTGETWEIDGSGVPATVAGSAALYIDGAYLDGERNAEGLTRHYSRKV